MNVKAHGKRLLSSLLAASMLLSCSVFASAASDIDGHWAQKEMQSFIDKDLMQGFGDGVYSPDGSMTRAQLATLINRITNLSTQADLSAYQDVKTSDWYYADLAKAVAAGYMNGTSATTMSPNDTVTREQAVTMLARLLGLQATAADLAALEQYSDLSQVDSWAKDAFAAIVAAGYVQGTTASTLSPLTYLTRAQGVTVLSRAMEALEGLGGADAAGTLKDGVYTGTGAGYGGTITVQMTVSNGKIADLEITKHSETGSYLRRAQVLLTSVLEKQTTEGVDTISGATKSSKGILTAINACLSQAKGGADTSTTGSTGGGGGGAGASTPTQGQDFLGALKDGTYEGSAVGYSGGLVKVTVTVKDNKITEVVVNSHNDTSSYFNKSKAVIDKVIAAQSTDVDVVSNATYSSYGILNAINDALKEAIPSTDKTYQVSTWKEFTTALAKAVDGDTIQLTGDITDAGERWQDGKKDDGSSCKDFADAITSATLGMATINKAVTIDGANHKISTVEGMAYSFNIGGSGVVMKDLTIDGASYGKKMGGGLYLAGSKNSTATPSLALTNVTIQNCVSYKTTMPGNGGGAIYCKGNVTLTATDCTFDGNVVNVGLGGAVLAQNANVTLTGCTFTGNTAQYGGAIAATGSANLTVTNCTFTAEGKKDNNATYGGDDIYIFDGKTPGKSGSFSNSTVSYALSGNTYSADGETWEDYAVVMGRFLITNDPTTDKNGKVTYVDYLGSGIPFAINDGHDLTFTSWERTELQSEDKTEYQYLLMNIPYDKFYAAELNNDIKVDSVSSATKNKTRTGSLVAGSYHVNADGTDITGITFPVAVAKGTDLSEYTRVVDTDSVTIKVTNRGQANTTTYNGKDALFEKDSYAYYVLSEAPTYFKVMAVEGSEVTFGKTQGISTALSGVKTSLQTVTTYGDYQINLVDNSGTITSDRTIYGVILSTKEGDSYGLRHLENVWRGTELAFCTGFTNAVHSCPTDSEHYKAIMGQTVNQITYLMDTGFYTVSTDLYIPVKFSHTFSVDNADRANGTAAVTMTGFPEDYAAQYTVTNADGEAMTTFSCDGKAVTWTGTPAVGVYTLTVSDTSGKYAPYSTDFQVTTGTLPVQAGTNGLNIVAIGDADLAAYTAAITSVKVGDKSYDASGKKSTVIINENGFVDLTAAPFADMKAGSTYAIEVTANGYSTNLTFTLTVPKTLYTYAALTYAEYWQNENVYLSGSDMTASDNETPDRTYEQGGKKYHEYDKGAFDAVSRATTNHGLHRGSFQQSVTITGSEKTYAPLYWTDGNNFVAADGKTYNKNEIGLTSYQVTGIKYVPVSVAADDYQAFCKAYTVTQNGEALQGGYSEKNLTAYTDLVANVTADTNGLKAATLTGDTWSFAKRATGSDSGILGQTLTQAANVTEAVKSDSSYGDFVRVDLNGDGYGALGSMLQTVVWTYYGDGDTALATYGTKFAADNWMHKSMGIQLGLTESLRCQLPEGTDGTGKWTVTVYALGYADYTVTVTVLGSDLHGSKAQVPLMTDEQKDQLTDLMNQAKFLIPENYDADTASDAMKALKEHYDEAEALLANDKATSAQAEELIGELPGLIAAASSPST